jgi:hypothetical protein
MFNQPIRTSKLYMITQLQSIFFLCFDFSFEVNRYLVLFGSIITVLLIAVVAVL